MGRWFRPDHAHYWASVLFAVFVLGPVVTQSLKYGSLARRGLSATATVLAYEPSRPTYRGGGYTHHEHLLSFAGHVVFYGIVPTYQPSHFGRVYAAYGGWFVVLSLLWGWSVDHTAPDRYDLLSARLLDRPVR